MAGCFSQLLEGVGLQTEKMCFRNEMEDFVETKGVFVKKMHEKRMKIYDSPSWIDA